MDKDLHSGRGIWGEVIYIEDRSLGDRIYVVDMVDGKMKAYCGYWVRWDRVENISELPEEIEVGGGVTWMRYSDGYESEVDSRGNLLWRKEPDGGEYSYKYDERDNMIELNKPNGDCVTYVYGDGVLNIEKVNGNG